MTSNESFHSKLFFVNADTSLGSSGILDPSSWTTTIEFFIDEPLLENQTIIKDALLEIEAVCCLKFVEIKEKNVELLSKEYIHFESSEPGCFSNVGKLIKQPTRVNLEIGPNCLNPVAVKHEVMHALGFIHEHQRPDRDSFVKIVQNKKPDLINVHKRNDRDPYRLYTPYDYHSIMHYTGMQNGTTILKPFNPVFEDLIRYPSDMSIGDEVALNLHFNCPTIGLAQFVSYLQLNDYYTYQELKQFEIKETDITRRSYLLYPYRIIITTMDNVKDIYPRLEGEFRRIPRELINGRPVWKHKIHEEYHLIYDHGRWGIVDEISNFTVARTINKTKSIMLEISSEAWGVYDRISKTYTPYTNFFIQLFPERHFEDPLSGKESI